MRNVPDKNCRENQGTHFVFSKQFFSRENPTFYEIMRKTYLEAGQAKDENTKHAH